MTRTRLEFVCVWLAILAFCAGSWLLAFWGAHEAFGASECGTNVGCLHKAIAWQAKDRRRLRREIQAHRASDLRASIEIASILFGVSARDMTCIAWAESGYGRQTTSEAGSGALGPFQWLASSWATTPLGRAGYSRLDPLAASLTTAQRVVQDGGWHEWVTASGCGL